MKTRRGRIFILLLSTIFVLGGWGEGLDIQAKSYSKSRSYSSSSSYSKSYSKTSSSTYKKTSSSSSSSGSGYRKSTSSTGNLWSKRSGGSASTSTSSSPKETTSTKIAGTGSSTTSGAASGTKTSMNGYTKTKSSSTQGSGFTATRYDKEAVQKIRQQKSAQSLKAYKQENAKFKKTTSTFKGGAGKTNADKYSNSPLYNKVKRHGTFDYNRHYESRDTYYRDRHWSRPSYAYNSFPSFGMWDALFLWMILDNITQPSYAAFAHNHANDPDFMAWKEEAEKLADTNKELQEKLETMNTTLAGMTGPRDPQYIPPDVPAEIALAAPVLAAKPADDTPLRLATGSKSGNYYFFGEKLKKFSEGVQVEILSTAGSMENLRLLHAKKADAALVQSDVFNQFKKQFPDSTLISQQTDLYPEAIQLLTNRDAGIKSVKDINPQKHTLLIGPEGSGTALTWKGLCDADGKYEKIPTKYMSYEQGLAEVSKNTTLAMLFVSGLNSNLLNQAESMAKKDTPLRLAAVDDWDFNDKRDQYGNRIYTFTDIPASVYPALQKGWMFGADITTLAVTAVLVVRNEWIEEYGDEAFEALSFAIMEAQDALLRRVNLEQ